MHWYGYDCLNYFVAIGGCVFCGEIPAGLDYWARYWTIGNSGRGRREIHK